MRERGGDEATTVREGGGDERRGVRVVVETVALHTARIDSARVRHATRVAFVLQAPSCPRNEIIRQMTNGTASGGKKRALAAFVAIAPRLLALKRICHQLCWACGIMPHDAASRIPRRTQQRCMHHKTDKRMFVMVI